MTSCHSVPGPEQSRLTAAFPRPFCSGRGASRKRPAGAMPARACPRERIPNREIGMCGYCLLNLPIEVGSPVAQSGNHPHQSVGHRHRRLNYRRGADRRDGLVDLLQALLDLFTATAMVCGQERADGSRAGLLQILQLGPSLQPCSHRANRLHQTSSGSGGNTILALP